MGNAFGCVSANCSNQAARIVDWKGNLRSIEIPATAADLMLESPGHLVSLAEDVRRTRRFSGMKAEEELRSGGAYLLVPVDRVGSRATDRQMDVVEAVVVDGTRSRRHKKAGKGRRSGKVFPTVACDVEENGADKGKSREGRVTGFPGYRLSTSRCCQWKPVLHTIQEKGEK